MISKTSRLLVETVKFCKRVYYHEYEMEFTLPILIYIFIGGILFYSLLRLITITTNIIN